MLGSLDVAECRELQSVEMILQWSQIFYLLQLVGVTLICGLGEL